MIEQVRPADLATWLEAQARPVVLDVREPEELATASVPARGFDLVAIPMNSVPTRLAELDPKRAVAVLCHRGARSQRVALFLENNGFDQVVNIAGGIDAWALERDRDVPRY